MNGAYAPDYPATAYNYSTNTDDTAFHPYVASISVRENRRNLTSGTNAEWINPYYHTTSDIESSYTRDDDADGKRDDIELGYNAVRTTLGLVAELAGAHIATANTAPVANPQSVTTNRDTTVAITLTGSDVDSDPLIFSVTTPPGHGTLSGTAPNLTYTPAVSFSGADSFTFIINDGHLNSAPATVSITVQTISYGLPFQDDFETSKGWVVTPGETDGATDGAWERGVPEATDFEGLKQLATPPSGTQDLVTGHFAGANASSHDVDGGVTSIRSPDIQLPTGQDITLALNYTFAHARNASPDDYFRVQVVGATTVTVLEVRGDYANVDAAWRSFSASLNSFEGQKIYVLIEAADRSRDSLVEAAVDDVSITAAAPSGSLLTATFDSDSQGFGYADDAFRGTAQPGYASGAWVASGGHSGGALRVILGGLDTEIVTGISGGWSRSFTVATAGPVNVSFWFKLTQSPDYEAVELSQVLVSVDGMLYGSGTHDDVAQIGGNGNDGIDESSGWQLFSTDLATLGAGSHTLTLGGYNNRKSYTNETTEVLVDDVKVAAC